MPGLGAVSREDIDAMYLSKEVKAGNIATVRTMIRNGVSIQGSVRIQPLMIATFFRRVPMVKLLIDLHADVNARTVNPPQHSGISTLYLPFEGERPLHAASYCKNLEILRLLLQAGADPNAVNDAGLTPLMGMCKGPAEGRWRQIARALLDAGADVSLVDNSGCTTLLHAASGGSVDVIRMILSEAPHMLNRVGDHGETELFMVAKEGHAEAASYLLSVGARHPRTLEHDCCPLTVAMCLANHDVARILMSDGMEAIGGAAYAMPMALAGAVGRGRPKELHWVLNVDGEENAAKWTRCRGFLGGPLLHYAAGYIKPYSVRMLLAAGADETALDGAGQRAIDVIATMDEENPPLSPLTPRIPDRKRDPVLEAEIHRTLLRAPAYRARSWLWPSLRRESGSSYGGSDGDLVISSKATRKRAPVSGVRVFRPPRGHCFARLVHRYSLKQ